LLSEGSTKDEIYDIFLDKYGPTVLISPPFSGFNILAWVLPFIALLGAGYFIYKYVKEREQSKSIDNSALDKPLEYEDKIEDELMRTSIEEEMKKYR